jgi:hypothetical protein
MLKSFGTAVAIGLGLAALGNCVGAHAAHATKPKPSSESCLTPDGVKAEIAHDGADQSVIDSFKPLSPGDFKLLAAAFADAQKPIPAATKTIYAAVVSEETVLVVAFDGKGCMNGLVGIPLTQWADIFGGGDAKPQTKTPNRNQNLNQGMPAGKGDEHDSI